MAPPGEDTGLPITLTVTGQTSAPALQTYDYALPVVSKIVSGGYPTSGCLLYKDADSDAQTRSCSEPAVFVLEGENFGLSQPTVTVLDILNVEIECTIVKHTHFAIHARLPPGIGSAVVATTAGSIGKQRPSNTIGFLYNKPVVNSVWSGPTLKSLQKSSVFDASAPTNELLFIFGDNLLGDPTCH